jgi:hypothetical protein
MVEKDKPNFHASRRLTATTFLMIGIISTGILSVFTPVLNHIAIDNHIAIFRWII